MHSEAALKDKLQEQMLRLKKLEFFQSRFEQCGVEPEDIKDFSDLQQLPFMTRNDLEKDFFDLKPPYGSFFNSEVIRFNLTPTSRGLYPIYYSARDLETIAAVNASLIESAGVTSNDVVANCMGHHIFVAGLIINDCFQKIGAKIIPLGPGESERAIGIINQYRVSVLIANASFAVKLGGLGADSIRIVLAGGEPVPKDQLKAVFGEELIVAESYGLAECLPVARECRFQNGSHIAEEFVFVEIIDPETGNNLPCGEKGEIVVTHIDKDAMPLLRYRTGDLAVLEDKKCPCGRHLSLPKGILGRIDQMCKVKGVKLYPSQVRVITRIFPELTGKYRIKITKKNATDYLQITFEGDKKIDTDVVRAALKQGLIIEPNELEIVNELEDGPMVTDER
ncbi:MAG: AMP-binding protein [Thermodesulfobacteriota bacterium]|nr:AMP-binding protein [Thermodesulfobacteriota bacterium]